MEIQNRYVTTGQEAIDLVRSANEKKRPFDICLIDWKMPDMDCMEIIRQAKRYGSNEGEDDFHAGRIRRIKTFI